MSDEDLNESFVSSFVSHSALVLTLINFTVHVTSCRAELQSRHQTIDKVGQLFGRGLVSEDNRLMKLLNHDTCHLSRHDCDVKKWQAIRTPTLLCCFIF